MYTFSTIVTPQIGVQFDVEKIVEDLKQIAIQFPSENISKAISYLTDYARDLEDC